MDEGAWAGLLRRIVSRLGMESPQGQIEAFGVMTVGIETKATACASARRSFVLFVCAGFELLFNCDDVLPQFFNITFVL